MSVLLLGYGLYGLWGRTQSAGQCVHVLRHSWPQECLRNTPYASLAEQSVVVVVLTRGSARMFSARGPCAPARSLTHPLVSASREVHNGLRGMRKEAVPGSGGWVFVARLQLGALNVGWGGVKGHLLCSPRVRCTARFTLLSDHCQAVGPVCLHSPQPD